MVSEMSNQRKIGICGATTTPSSMLLILLALICSATAGDDANQLDFTSGDCTLTEPVYGYKFDFSKLRSDLAHVVRSVSNDIFEFNVCSNLTYTCNNESNVAACLKRQGKEYVLGRRHELHYHNGKMYLEYLSGAKCENGTKDHPNYQLHVILNCDYTLDTNPLQLTSFAEDTCSFYINYDTPLACLSIPDAMQSNSCSVPYTSAGNTFDLMELSDVNYRTTDRQGNFFIINVCKPVLYGENTMCPAGSSICLFSPKATDLKKRFINFGNVQTQPVYKNEQLLLLHNSSTPCARNSKLNYSSVVHFHCDKNVRNAHPEYVGLDQDGCTYQFNFITPLACKNLKPCTARTASNELLDLSALSKRAPHKLSKDGKTYNVAVCAGAGTPCLANGGACYEENGVTYALGNFNGHLRFNQSGSPYLLYEDGVKCENDNRRWSTKIEFVCASNATKDSVDAVHIIEDSNCQLLIQYWTPLACLEQIRCTEKIYVDNSEDGTGGGGYELFDITPLINNNDNYEARVELPASQQQQLAKNTKFFLNVCRPLVPKYQLGCAGGSAVCMAKMSAAGAAEEEYSLGFPLISLAAINRTTVELLYLHGDPCPTDKATNLSTTIRFRCNMRSGRGQPVLSFIDDCNYHFDWDTSVICPPHECTFIPDTCEMVQNDLNMRYNFKNASFTKDGKIAIHNNNSQLELNVCGPHRKAMTDYSQDLVNLFFTHDLPGCGKEGKMNVHMRVICSSKTESSFTITNDTQCSLLYVQRTPSICSFLSLSVPTQDDSGSSSSSSSTSTTSTTTSTHATPMAILGLILSVTFFVACVGLFAVSPARRQRVRRLFRRNSSAVRYSRVQSNEEANLLLEPNGEFTESDDDMLL
ncbi:cation-independent mannose-6-phosphate receptor isoform X2 [Drosophila hydei]|uniref:Cation-independent mannose-6-phosphate receptor isoform X2 n=1 Tax=Drosophila hydei TaxID=7224 RepID=A0A6J1M6T9_DROHY|nr:cation-independent mannose-6-phosphate receptor isoform X2 [Drosophila hydei]